MLPCVPTLGLLSQVLCWEIFRSVQKAHMFLLAQLISYLQAVRGQPYYLRKPYHWHVSKVDLRFAVRLILIQRPLCDDSDQSLSCRRARRSVRSRIQSSHYVGSVAMGPTMFCGQDIVTAAAGMCLRAQIRDLSRVFQAYTCCYVSGTHRG